MAKNVFICATEALRRYGKSDLRTLQSWGRKGYILYQVINAGGKNPEWLFESPEARFERTMGLN